MRLQLYLLSRFRISHCLSGERLPGTTRGKMKKESKINLRERVIVALDTSDLKYAKKLVRLLNDSVKIFKIGS